MELFPPNHTKHRDADYLAKLQLFTTMENMDSEGSPSITDNTPNTLNILISSEITHKQSMSDDEAYARFNSKNKLNRSYSHSTNDTNNSNDSFDADTISPLKLRDVQSANTYQGNKRRKQRSNSAMISSKGSRRRKQNSILQRQCRDLQSQLKIYQDKITDIQDDAEETEDAIRREFELRLLHLETKYLREKSEKKSLQSEVEKIRQELFRRETSFGYSSTTAATISPVLHNNNSKNQFYDTTNIQPQRPMIQAYNSNNTVVINSSNQNTPHTPNTINTNHSSVSSNSNSNSYSSSSSSSSTSSTNSSMSDTTSSYSSTNTNSTDNTESYMEENSHDTINMEKAKGKYSRIGGKRKYKGKQKKIPQKYKKNKTKSFWDNLWGLFGPPNLMCTTCSDNK